MDQSRLDQIKHKLDLGEVKFLPITTSTNDVAKQLLATKASHKSLVVADEQTKGRGRSGRTWITPANASIAASYILTENIKPNYFLRYSGLASLAVCDVLSTYSTDDIKIKWPNDILINSLKVSGILVEAYWLGPSIKGIILGIGINITEFSLPDRTAFNFPVTYLNNHVNTTIDRGQLLMGIIERINFWNNLISSDEFIEEWEKFLAFRGEKVKLYFSETRTSEGILEGLASNGEIVISLPSGEQFQYNANEIQLRKYTS